MIEKIFDSILSLFVKLPPKRKEEHPLVPIIIDNNSYTLLYKYCVDTHKYIVVGKIIKNDNVVFNMVYDLPQSHIYRAYHYAFFSKSNGNYKTFVPSNPIRQIFYDKNNNMSYVIGYIDGAGKSIYYDQYIGE